MPSRLERLSDPGAHGARLAKIVVALFHRLYYYDGLRRNGTWSDTRWLGVPTQKNPLDLWVYQEILFETRPEIVVETGTASGGSALYLASLCDLLGTGRVISVDIDVVEGRPEHERITYLTGSSTSEEIVAKVREQAAGAASVMVVLDSDHRKGHVLDELRLYSALVTVGGYLVVEDTNINGHPVYRKFGPGPMEAVDEFLRGTSDFVIDTKREKFHMTFNPGGYLCRVC
jgi:cephalosporin hydroxylase